MRYEHFYFRDLLGAAYSYDYRCGWHFSLYVPKLDPRFHAWDVWQSVHAAVIWRSGHSPHRTEKQNLRAGMEKLKERYNTFMYAIGVGQDMAPENTSIRIDFWVNQKLTDEDKEVIKASAPDFERVLGDFGALAFEGYRLSVSYDDYSKAVQASLVCASPGKPNSGCGISARHPDLDTALLYLLYKVTTIGNRPWRDFAPPPRQSDWG